jgi:hypothetical protein
MCLESPLFRSTPETHFQPVDTEDHIQPKRGTVILQPVAMRIPNSHGVYSPSQLKPLRIVSYEEFLTLYATHPRGIRVCFDESPTLTTILEQSELLTAYGLGLDCWYVVAAYSGIQDPYSE